MFLPSAEAYLSLIEEKDPTRFSFLNDYQFSAGPSGKVVPFHTSDHALLFRATKGGRDFVIRLFLKGDAEFFSRYDQRAHYLSSLPLSWKLPFEFYEQEIRVEGKYLPALAMEWSPGLPLYQYIDRILLQPQKIIALQEALIRLSRSLEENGAGHGDLNMHHLLVVGGDRGPAFGLVDYDNLYIPDLIGTKSMDAGTPGFQHPKRLATDFSEYIDRFSIWILLAALEALRLDTGLWTSSAQLGYQKERNLLFTMRDLTSPETSKLIRRLRSLTEPALHFYLDQIQYFCTLPDASSIAKPEIFKKGMKPSATPVKSAVASPLVGPESTIEVEIKSVPSGRDLLVRGSKKGTTPIRLQLHPRDFGFVEIVNDGQKIPLAIHAQRREYAIELPNRFSESGPDGDEILDFHADNYSVKAGEQVTLHWKVKGKGPVHISGVGEVTEKSGRKKLTVKQSTRVVLSVGIKSQALAIEVQPLPKARRFQASAQKKGFEIPRLGNNLVIALVIAAAIIAATLYLLPSGDKADEEQKPGQVQAGGVSTDSVFSVARVQTMLNDLYDAYNRRNLADITKHYAPVMDAYYNSTRLRKDSLNVILRDLFIKPTFYSCRPDFSTLKLEPSGDRCKLTLTISETLQPNLNEAREKYDTRVQYIVDRDMRIVSETPQ